MALGVLILSGIFLIASKNLPPEISPNSDWKTYISNDIGIEFQYPEGFFYQEPATLTLNCQTAAIPGKCPEIKNEIFTSQKEVSIGGKAYCAQVERDAAAGSAYDKSIFAIQNERGCFALDLVVRSTNCGVYGMPEDAEYQKCEKENAEKPGILEKILLSFKDTQKKTDFGFIRKIELKDGKYFAGFDNAVWLNGLEAENAAIRAGHCTEESRAECLPNGYFILNVDKTPVETEISKSVVIEMETLETGEPGDKKEIIPLEKLAELVNNATLPWNQLPYHLVIENNRIIKISEQYIP